MDVQKELIPDEWEYIEKAETTFEIVNETIVRMK